MFSTPGDVSTVLALNLAVALALYALPRLLAPQRTYDRLLFGGITAALVVTYLAWRWTDTLPPLEPTAEALWPYLFFTFEAVAITYTLMSIAILMRTKDRSAEADAAQGRHAAANDWPAVDVFICTYNEPLDVLEKSILPALAIDYPHKTVWVLDDTRRDWLRDYCDRVGARYLRRPDNTGAKAGNLNNGLRATAVETNAPLILVLDADFAPQADILTRMVGLFDDPRAAVVQSPQFFFNADPIQHNLSASESWVDDQRIFFDVFQPAKDAWGCSFCVGTSFIVRRDRLNEIGGFPDAAICEDLNLSCGMMRAGYRTHWLNERLSMGLSAEGLPEYITQRTRWCLGTMQVALLRSGPLLGSGYTLVQRLHFIHGVLNWLCKPFIVLMLIAPAVYWFAGLPAFQADTLSFLRFGLPMLLAVWAYNGWISGSRTLPLFMEVTHTMTALPITVTLAVAAVKPFGRPFKVTDKGGDRSQMMVRWRLAALFGGFSLLSAVSIVWAFVATDAAAEVSSMDYFNLVWAGVAMVLTFVAFLVCFEYPRTDLLFPCELDATLEAGGRSVPAPVTHLSTDRATIGLGLPVPPGGAVLHLPGIGAVPASGLGDGPSGFRKSGHRFCDKNPRQNNDLSGRSVGLPAQVCLVRLEPDFAQRRALVLMLYGTPRDRIARQARMAGAMAGLVRRGLGLS